MKTRHWLILLITLSFYSCHYNDDVKAKLSKIDQLPNFSLEIFPTWILKTSNTLQSQDKLVFLYFSTDCPHCKREIPTIYANMMNFRRSVFVLVTSDSYKDISTFCSNNNLVTG